MNIQRAWAITLRQLYLYRDNPTRFWQMFVWVTVDIIIWGFITKYLSDVVPPTFGVVQVFLGAVILWGFVLRTMQGVTTSFLEDVWSKNFLNLFASPLKISEYIVGLIIASILGGIIVFVAMLVLAFAAFGVSMLTLGIALVPFLVILFLFGIALGIIGLSLVLRLGPIAEWLVWPIPAVLNPFAGVFYPIATLPLWMQVISYFLPPAYVFEGMRTIIQAGEMNLFTLAHAFVLVIVWLVLAYWFFAATYKKVVRNGLIARFEAEGP